MDSHRGGQLQPNRDWVDNLQDGERACVLLLTDVWLTRSPTLVVWNSYGLCGLTHRNQDMAKLFHPRHHCVNHTTAFMFLRRAGGPTCQRTSRSLEMSLVRRLKTMLIIIILLSQASLAVLTQERNRIFLEIFFYICRWVHIHHEFTRIKCIINQMLVLNKQTYCDCFHSVEKRESDALNPVCIFVFIKTMLI